MHDLRAPLKASELAEDAPNVRHHLLSIAKHAFQDQRVGPERWEPILRFVEEAERPEDEIGLVQHLQNETERGRNIDEGDIEAVFELIDRTSRDLRSLLQERVQPGVARDDEWAEVEAGLEEYISSQTQETKTARMAKVTEFVEQNPGLYIQKLHNRLRKDASFRISYSGLLNYVNELEEHGEVLTVGGPKGHPRFCFPHPSKIDRTSYFGRKYPVSGTIEEDVTSYFEWRSVFASAYVVNPQFDPLVLVMPDGVDLHQSERVEGFGKLESISWIEDKLPLRDGPPDGINELVLPELLHGENGEGIEIPETFQASLGYREGPTQ